jgi:hypothetical protein
VTLRLHRGEADQMPDPLMEAVEGLGEVPGLSRHCLCGFRGSRPYALRQSRAAVLLRGGAPREARASGEALVPAPADMLQAVAMIPGTGEYALSTTPVHFSGALGAAGRPMSAPRVG